MTEIIIKGKMLTIEILKDILYYLSLGRTGLLNKRVIVIGGGAAGMMAAITAAENGADVILLEQNEKLGKKIYITGKGRCNVTFSSDAEDFFAHVIRNPKFMYSAYYGFDNHMLMEKLEKAGCPLKVERGERVFPVSDHSSDVIHALQNMLHRNNVEIRLRTKVKDLIVDEASNRLKGVTLYNGEELLGDAVILATGGFSYQSTGSTGDGYTFAEKLGMDVKEAKPALVPINIKEDWCKELQGVSLKNVTLTMEMGKKTLYKEFGEMLFTHFGLSGPLVLSASSLWPDKMKEEIRFKIDLKPALSYEQLDKRLIRELESANNKQFKNSLGSLFPTKMIPVMIELSGIHPEKKCNEVSREERNSFCKLIKELTLTADGLRDFNEAIITRGGINVKEVNPSTMESKKIKGLFIAGEVLDVDAFTGGFNLQIAWSTGALAGESAASICE